MPICKNAKLEWKMIHSFTFQLIQSNVVTVQPVALHWCFIHYLFMYLLIYVLIKEGY